MSRQQINENPPSFIDWLAEKMRKDLWDKIWEEMLEEGDDVETES